MRFASPIPAVPFADRVSGDLSRAVLAELCSALADVPLAGKAPQERRPRRSTNSIHVTLTTTTRRCSSRMT
jgi:hypothetical protein